jgi:hypothetical protein
LQLLTSFLLGLVSDTVGTMWLCSYVKKTNKMHTFSERFISVELSLTCLVQIIVHHQKVCTSSLQYQSIVSATTLLSRCMVNQYSKTNVIHFLFHLLRINGLYMFRSLLDHLQEALHKRNLVYYVRVTSVGSPRIGLEHSNPGAAN